MKQNHPLETSIPLISSRLNQRHLTSIRPLSVTRALLYFSHYMLLVVYLTKQHLGSVHYDVLRFIFSSYVILLLVFLVELLLFGCWRTARSQINKKEEYQLLPSSLRIGPLMILDIYCSPYRSNNAPNQGNHKSQQPAQKSERKLTMGDGAYLVLVVFSDQVSTKCWREWCLKLAFIRSQSS